MEQEAETKAPRKVAIWEGVSAESPVLGRWTWEQSRSLSLSATLQDWGGRGAGKTRGGNPLKEPPPLLSPAPRGRTTNRVSGRGCGKQPQPIAVEGVGPGCPRRVAGSPWAKSSEQLRGAADQSRMEDPVAPGAGSPPANGNGNGGGGKGKPASPKGREAFKSQRRESEVSSRESFCWSWETPGGRKLWLRWFAPVPVPHPEAPLLQRSPSRPLLRALRGPPQSGLWTLPPGLPLHPSPAASRSGLCGSLASAAGDAARPRTYQIVFKYLSH